LKSTKAIPQSSQANPSNLVSLFKGVRSKQVAQATWQAVLEEEIRSEKNKKWTEHLRRTLSVDKNKYRKEKAKSPSVTFSGTFPHERKNNQINTTTCLITSDLDHLENVEEVFSLVILDPVTHFAFRSPAGDGLKIGIRSMDIKNDADHKRFYAATERYFKKIYGLTTDKSCKDICRLTFLPHDRDLYINPSPTLFDVEKGQPPA